MRLRLTILYAVPPTAGVCKHVYQHKIGELFTIDCLRGRNRLSITERSKFSFLTFINNAKCFH